MKLAVLGAPGANKTKFAQSLARKLNGPEKWTVVDGYVDKLKKQTGLDFGAQTNFVQEIEVLGARWAAEDEAYKNDANSITCGTIYETIIYASNQSKLYAPTEDELIKEQIYIQTMMHAFGALEQMTFDYHALIYLPREGKFDRDWSEVVDAKIPEVLEGFGKHPATLRGTHKQKVDRAIEYLSPLFPATPDEQPAV